MPKVEKKKISVLVVDDSLFMRALVSDMLNSDPDINVIDTAKDGREAVEKISGMMPDCVTLDLAMPGWDGLTTLNSIMANNPTPVIILSAHSKKDAAVTFKCLKAGAVGFVLKPSGELSLDIKDVKQELLKAVKAASRVRNAGIKSLAGRKIERLERKPISINRIIVIGASTGGPQGLETILYSLPINLPVPVIIVQHMPSKFFTESLADHLNKASDLDVKLARNGDVLCPGRVYLAPGGSQTEFLSHKKEERTSSDICDHPGTESVSVSVVAAGHNILSPSINLTMKSAVEIYGENTIGIILSGMGDDGMNGMKAIKESGGRTIVQDESSLIFGMPKAVIDAKVADKILPVEKIADTIMEYVNTDIKDRNKEVLTCPNDEVGQVEVN